MAKKNLEEIAYDAIMKLIFEHHFKPGDLLLETELTEMLKMRSRTPVRHALTRLEARGFIIKMKKKGCMIPSPSPEDAKAVFFAREHIEGLNAASAAENCLPEDIVDLRRVVEKESEHGSIGNKVAYSKVNEAFHSEVAKKSKNKYLFQYSRHIFWRSSYYTFFFESYYTHKTDYQQHMQAPLQHLAIIDAIENKDTGKAEELMKAHIRNSYDEIFSRISMHPADRFF
mgnify:FL=1